MKSSITEARKIAPHHRARELIWDQKNVSKFWDYWAGFPETYFTFQFGDRIIKSVERYLVGKSILDYGCGAGHLTGHLLSAGYRVTACDLSRDSVSAVEAKFNGHPRFGGVKCLADMGGDDLYDALFLIEVVEHLHDADLEAAFGRISELLRSSGVLIISTPNREDLAAGTVYCPTCSHSFHRWQHVRSWNADALARFLKEQGFDVIETIETDLSYTSPLVPPERFHKRLIRRIFDLPAYERPMGRPHLLCVARKIPSGKGRSRDALSSTNGGG